ncbi:unnamed protein product [Rotaria socialis]|uniref:Pyrroline-5-carboxylate reductase catalytic N-terminal domain-containing protein n=1 Tax=Rotaria socialis TaxID=392032 RepID=A0A821JPY6_9BILA|nr:unnamed protein product [Rotaria socialis]CAF3235734.1 unnamed protein product [Rotaria socialis]CAF3327823.1 unnamed protein product [Rotaria socialis]CAF3406488.1 unnamed protein product [Rotaria socialis]CAF3784586.1 unnamed protein product [Rotaria socialis]
MELFQSSTLKTLFDPPTGDLIAGLETIQFKTLCPGEYNSLFIQLRRRSNLLTTTHIAHACQFIALANRIKREGDKLKGTPDKKRSHRLMAEVRREPGLKIGIIGVGRIGHLLATFLLKYGDVYPDELYLSSRQADLLTDMTQLGVGFCKFNNAYIVQHCDIVFLCVAPHHIRYIVDDIRDRIKSKVLIYSLVLGFPSLKLSSLLKHILIIKPSYQVNEAIDKDESLWPPDDDIESVIRNDLLLKRISLENEDQNDSLVRDDELVPTISYALLNILKQNASLNRIQSLRVLSALLFNNSNIDLIIEKFDGIETNHEYFPDFDLVHLANKKTVIRDLLDDNTNLRRLFFETFISHFTQFK